MITIEPRRGETEYTGTEHYVLSIGDEVTCVDFGPQVDDVLISSPEGDILCSWDTDGWQEDECLLIKTFDNLKELGNVKCTKFYLKSYVPGKTVKVFLTIQRN
jgi:hypothetical protein